MLVLGVLPLVYRLNNSSLVLDKHSDSLIILHACRFDVFVETFTPNRFEGQLIHRISRGTDIDHR